MRVRIKSTYEIEKLFPFLENVGVLNNVESITIDLSAEGVYYDFSFKNTSSGSEFEFIDQFILATRRADFLSLLPVNELPEGITKPGIWLNSNNNKLTYFNGTDNEDISGVSSININSFPFISTEDIPKFSLICATGDLANTNELIDYDRILGIALDDTPLGSEGRYVNIGEITNPSWNFLPGDVIYLNGKNLSKVPADSGFIYRVGLMRTPTIMVLCLQDYGILI